MGLTAAQKVVLNAFGKELNRQAWGDILDGAFGAAPKILESSGTLTQANIVAMNGTPVSLVAAQGAGTLIVVDEIELFHSYSTAAYSGGGDVAIQYNTSAKLIEAIDVAAITTTASEQYIFKPSASYTSTVATSSQTDLASSANKAVEITNATAVFAAGNVANVFKYKIRYHVVTLLT